MTATKPEPWLRGPLPGIPPLLQPVGHTLVAAYEDASEAAGSLSVDQLWTRLGGSASAGFHIMHLAGSTDRLLTYARGEALGDAQFTALEQERTVEEDRPPLEDLIDAWRDTVDSALRQLSATSEATLTDPRSVGRAKLPSTVMGLLFHAAEHASRHAGQVVTTAKILRATTP